MQLKFTHWHWQKILLAILLIEIIFVFGIWVWDNQVLRTVLNTKIKTRVTNLLTIIGQITTLKTTQTETTIQSNPARVTADIPSNIGANKNPKFSIIAGGTVVLSRGVAERIIKYQDSTYPWQKIAEEFKNADLAIVNFKGALTKDCVYERETLKFCGKPEYIQGLKYTGVDIVSLAGNHIGDYGTNGILETIDILNQNKILHAGAGENPEEALKPIIYEITPSNHLTMQPFNNSPIKVGFLAYNSVPTQTPIASPNSAGIIWLIPENLEKDIQALRPQVDILIVMPNWGEEYTHEPSDFQIEMGHKMIDLGADLVLGDQAHWVQKIEKYQDKYIFYGLGNLIFDQMWSQETREGLVVKFNFEGADLKSFDLMPVILEDYAQPRWASEEEKKKILESI